MLGDPNPFIYSHPVSPEEIIDRDEETEQLLKAAVGGHYVRLYAPRKFGKTSLLRRVLRDGEHQEGLIPILVDLYGVLSFADVAVRIERAYAKQLKGKLRGRIEELLQSTGLGLSLGALGVSAKLQIDPKVDPLPALHALLDLPLRLEEGGGFRALIVLDEFQDITKVKEMDALLRSHIQYQGEVASYIFSGSEPAMMKGLFEEKERPLYGQAVPFRLSRLADQDVAAHIVALFKETGRSVGEALNPLVDSAKGHPQRTMLLAHRLWEEVPAGGAATHADWRAAHEKASTELAPEFDAHWRRLETNQQKALRAVIAGGGSPYRTRTLERLQLSKGTARDAIRSLIGSAEVELEAGRHVIVDPLFAEWISALHEEGATLNRGGRTIRDAVRALRDEIGEEIVEAAGKRENPPSLAEVEDVMRSVVAATREFLEHAGYDRWQALRPQIVDAGGVALRMLQAEDEFDDDAVLRRHLRRSAQRVEHVAPPWELWLLTVSFYAGRLETSNDREGDLGAMCGLMIQALFAIGNFDWADLAEA
jgi:uncharacterized protein